MAENSVTNGDARLILARIDSLGKMLDEQKTRQGQYHEETQRRLELQQAQANELKLQTALLQQSHDAICDKVADNAQDIEKNDLWTKIIGGLTTFFIAAGTLIVAYLGTLVSRIRIP